MDMLRWLLGNKVVQVVWGLGILAVLLAWMFGGNKADHDVAATDSHAKVEQVAEANTSKEVDAKTEVVAEVKEEVAAVGAEINTVLATGVAAVATTAADGTQVASDAGQAVVETVKEAIATPVDQVVTEAVASVDQAAPVAVEATAETTQESADAVTESTEATVIVDGLAETSSEDLLMMAREAYWNNGLDEAAELYSVLIEREPTVIEHKGELGNVYWRQGFPKKAAELYADIAEPMIEQGNGERVSNMVGFIGLFFPDRAASIRQLLEK